MAQSRSSLFLFIVGAVKRGYFLENSSSRRKIRAWVVRRWGGKKRQHRIHSEIRIVQKLGVFFWTIFRRILSTIWELNLQILSLILKTISQREVPKLFTVSPMALQDAPVIMSLLTFSSSCFAHTFLGKHTLCCEPDELHSGLGAVSASQHQFGGPQAEDKWVGNIYDLFIFPYNYSSQDPLQGKGKAKTDIINLLTYSSQLLALLSWHIYDFK